MMLAVDACGLRNEPRRHTKYARDMGKFSHWEA